MGTACPGCAASAGDGRRQRHARLLLRRRRHATTEAAVAHGLRLHADGADLVDVGGESTRPGATRPLVAEELDRVVPVIARAGRARASRSRSTRCATRWPRRRSTPARCWSTTSPAGWPTPGCCGWSPSAVRRTSRCTGAPTPARCSATRTTTTWSPRSRAELRGAARRRRRRPGVDPDRLVLDPGLGFAKTADAQLGAARAAARARRRSGRRCWSGQPQVLPRARCSPAPTAPRGRSTTARTPTWR